MALHSISLLNPPPLAPMLDGVEFYVTECENVPAPDSTPFGDPREAFRACTVLVSLAKNDGERAAFRPLRHALAFGQTSSEVCNGAEWLQKLMNRLVARLEAPKHHLVTVVVYAGSDGDSDAETVQAAVDALRQCFGTCLAALLVVTARSHQFVSVQGISGFVVGANNTNAETARSLFLCLAMLSAPKTLNGIDLVDLLPVLGTASAPTLLAHALWLRQGEGRLVFASAADASTVRCAARLVAVPLIDGMWGWAELRRFSQAIEGEAIEAISEIVFAAEGPLAPGLCSSQVSMVPVLCATHAG